MAETHSKKGKRCKWVRYEHKHSNSLWHTDWNLLDDGRWFLCYEDDAFRFVTGYGVFDKVTTENSIVVLERVMADHGRPASIMADHGRPASIMADHGRPASIMADHGRPASIMADHGRPASIMADRRV